MTTDRLNCDHIVTLLFYLELIQSPCLVTCDYLSCDLIVLPVIGLPVT